MTISTYHIHKACPKAMSKDIPFWALNLKLALLIPFLLLIDPLIGDSCMEIMIPAADRETHSKGCAVKDMAGWMGMTCARVFGK